MIKSNTTPCIFNKSDRGWYIIYVRGLLQTNRLEMIPSHCTDISYNLKSTENLNCSVTLVISNPPNMKIIISCFSYWYIVILHRDYLTSNKSYLECFFQLFFNFHFSLFTRCLKGKMRCYHYRVLINSMPMLEAHSLQYNIFFNIGN